MTTVPQVFPMTDDQKAAANAAARTAADRKVGQSSDMADQKDMFMKLLIAQLKNQDPSSPMDQKDMMAQMAQFSQVEQAANMVKAVEQLSYNTTVSQSVSLIGHDVGYEKKAADGTTSIVTSKVTSITNTNNVLRLLLENGDKIDPTDVTQVA
jgi:flagellar basal-body rod modification protein FlgD